MMIKENEKRIGIRTLLSSLGQLRESIKEYYKSMNDLEVKKMNKQIKDLKQRIKCPLAWR